MTFTDSQKLACDISRNIAVTAGAGSGKTSVLVERYLWCLQNNDYQVRRVVAITFTEKAAGEMVSRIRRRILQHIASTLGDPQRWEEVLEKLPLAPISTIHGFCQRLLREFPIEAGVDPNFEVYDEALKHIHLIRLVDDVLRERAEASDPNLRVLSEMWSSPRTIREILVHLIETRERSLPWAMQISGDTFSKYLSRITALAEHTLQQGVQTIAASQAWQQAIESIRQIIPEGDQGKLTGRCHSILEFDVEFRQQTVVDQQVTILGMIRKNCSLIGVTKAWKEENRSVRLKEAFDVLKTLYARHLPEYSIQEALEQSGFVIQQALARLFMDVYALFQQEKARRRLLDFDDLQERALTLLNTQAIHALLVRRFDYIMVDEFQDTNHLQWEIIKKLGRNEQGLAGQKFCVVGDEKQSIYMFRGAEVSVFSQVRQELQQTNADHNLLDAAPKIPERGDPPQWQGVLTGELIMAENFRSCKELIFFFNYLFARLFLTVFDPNRPFDVQHQELLASRKEKEDSSDSTPDTEHPVEFLLVEQSEQPETEDDYEEPALVAQRILELVHSQPPRNFRDIAILLRTRTRLKEFEEALRAAHIPFIVAGGIGFYQQQEIYDLTNLLRVLNDTRQDIALAGVLRSPLLNFSDDQLFYLAAGFTSKSGNAGFQPALLASKDAGDPMTLWDKLQHHARHGDLIPQELAPSTFSYASKLLLFWKACANKIPITHLLQQVLDDTGFYGILSVDRRDVQAVTNIEKLLDLARGFEREGFQALSDFVAYLDQLIDTAEREGEAQIFMEGMNVVQLMTIHAAKGLQFPVVFVPELDRPFNYGTGESVYLDSISRSSDSRDMAAGIKGLNPDNNFEAETTFFREYLKRLNQEKTDAEMKRLFYVACTRAQDQLIFSATLKEKNAVNSWMTWLTDILPLRDALPQKSIRISDGTGQSDEVVELTIPIRTIADLTSAGLFDAHKTVLTYSHELEHLLEAVKADTIELPAVRQMLTDNFRPLSALTNTLLQVSPSTLHLLFQCPRRYYYQQILYLNDNILAPLRTRSEEEALSDEESEQLQRFGTERGTIIHKIFEEQIFDRDLNAQELAAAVTMRLDSMRIPAQKREQMHLDTAIQRAYSSYVETGLQRMLAHFPEVHREYPFYLPLGQVRISGILDVLFRDPETQTWTILDYKTNEIEANQIEAEIQRHGYDVQMQVYALAVSRLLQIERINSILFFTFPGCRYEAIDLSPSALRRFEQRLLSALQKLVENPLEMTEDQELCVSCPYREVGICEISTDK